MSLTYKFKKFRLEDGTYIKRPIVDIILRNNGKYLEFGAILDSGSDVTTIPKAVADYLDLKVQERDIEMVGYKGAGKVKRSKLTIVLKGKVGRLDEALNNVPVAVMQDPEEEDVIIGTSGIFEYFKIVFNDTKDIRITKL